VCVLSSLTKSGGVNGGTTAAVGHKYGFGNTEAPTLAASRGAARATDPSITTPARAG
jgi:hypothetical protein